MMPLPEHLCSICEQEMRLLPEKSPKGEDIYVCAAGKKKGVPCDGPVFENSRQR